MVNCTCACVSFRSQDVDPPISDLQEINMAGDDLSVKVEVELIMAVIGKIGCV